MQLTAEVVSKVETAMTNGINYKLHLKLAIDSENLEAQGGGILAAVTVDKDKFREIEVGSFIHFQEMTDWALPELEKGDING